MFANYARSSRPTPRRSRCTPRASSTGESSRSSPRLGIHAAAATCAPSAARSAFTFSTGNAGAKRHELSSVAVTATASGPSPLIERASQELRETAVAGAHFHDVQRRHAGLVPRLQEVVREAVNVV